VSLHRLFRFVLVLGFAAVLTSTAPCAAQQTVTETDKLFTADFLKMMLFARTPEEKWFCDYVIQKRDDGTIPAWIVYGVYQKAVAKERSRRFIYFRTGVETLCRREGIALYPVPASTAAKSASKTPAWIPSVFRGLLR